jgi:Zinc carboxypeptidase
MDRIQSKKQSITLRKNIMNDLNLIIKEFGELDKYMECPDFWLSKPENSMGFINSLKEAAVKTIGKSAGGREIIAIEYGEKEELNAISNNLSNSFAMYSGNPDQTQIFPEDFYGSNRRRNPVIVLQGALHGGELSGTAASLNLCNIIEKGVDLRGKKWPELQAMARKCRILIIPWLNPDGTARQTIPCSAGMPQDLYNRFTQGVKKDGTILTYPSCKKYYPIPLDEIAYLGTYYNDKGYNLQYDYTEIERQSETKTWMKYYLEEKPDTVMSWHCDSGSMIFPPSTLMPVGFQHQASRIGAVVKQRLTRDGYNVHRQSWVQLPGHGKSHALQQPSSIYHSCGALPILCEMPAGTDFKPFTADEMLDIGLITIEELLFYALEDGLRPYEYRPKVMAALEKEHSTV